MSGCQENSIICRIETCVLLWQLATVSDFKLSYPNLYLEVPKRACTAEKLRSMGVWAMEGGIQ